MIGLTPKQAECLKVISFLTERGVPPTYDEIGAALGLASKSGVHRLISGLEARGRVRRLARQSRALEVVPAPATPRLPTSADLLGMPVEALEIHLATVAGIIAHTRGGAATDRMLERIGARLACRPLRAAEIEAASSK